MNCSTIFVIVVVHHSLIHSFKSALSCTRLFFYANLGIFYFYHIHAVCMYIRFNSIRTRPMKSPCYESQHIFASSSIYSENIVHVCVHLRQALFSCPWHEAVRWTKIHSVIFAPCWCSSAVQHNWIFSYIHTMPIGKNS